MVQTRRKRIAEDSSEQQETQQQEPQPGSTEPLKLQQQQHEAEAGSDNEEGAMHEAEDSDDAPEEQTLVAGKAQAQDARQQERHVRSQATQQAKAARREVETKRQELRERHQRKQAAKARKEEAKALKQEGGQQGGADSSGYALQDDLLPQEVLDQMQARYVCASTHVSAALHVRTCNLATSLNCENLHLAHKCANACMQLVRLQHVNDALQQRVGFILFMKS